MHKHRVAHRLVTLYTLPAVIEQIRRDININNVMMDSRPLYDAPVHPMDPSMKRDFSGSPRTSTRTANPVRYHIIDFGISERFDASDQHPVADPILGGDKTVPEFKDIRGPMDPFPTDVYYVGNLIRVQFTEVRFFISNYS
jgi:hypothetical protein